MVKRKNMKVAFVLLLTCMLCLFMLNNTISIKAIESQNATLIRNLKFDGNDSYLPSGSYETVKSIDGSNAVRLKNTKNGTATQYIDLGAFDMNQKSASVAMWVKVASSQIEVNNYCSLISNKNWAAQTNPGFMVATSYFDGSFKGGWMDFSTAGNTAAYNKRNIANFDGYWHSIIVTMNRGGDMKFYSDGEEVSSLSISPLSAKSATGGNLFVGCDSQKKYGVIDTVFDNIEVYDGVMSEEQIAKHTYPILLEKEVQGLKTAYAAELESSRMTKAKKQSYLEILQEAAAEKTSFGEYKVLIERVRNTAIEILDTDERPLVTFNTASDIHIDGAVASSSNDVAIYEKKTQEVFTALSEMYSDTDALLIPGDYTRNGKVIDFDKFDKYLAKYNKTEKVLISLGNHEMRGIADFADIKKIFIGSMKPYGIEAEKVYYDTWINGHHFISLSSERNSEKTAAYLSLEQLAWFEQALAQDAKPNQPIFVMLHQPLEGSFPISEQYGVGAQVEALKSIMRKYPQIVFMSGHLHNGYIDERSVIKTEFGYLVDLPSIKQNDFANQQGNLTRRFEVYSDRTVIKTIDYIKRAELYEFRHTIYHNALAPEQDTSDIESVVAKDNLGGIIEGVTDNNPQTSKETSSTNRQDHEIVLDLGGQKSVSGLRYLAKNSFGSITSYNIEYSHDGMTWLGFSGSSGKFASSDGYNIASFPKISASYIKFLPQSSVSHSSAEFKTSAAELAIISTKDVIVSIKLSATIATNKGTEFTSLALPATVKVKLDSGGMRALAVTWKVGEYDKNTTGTYMVYGNVILDNLTSNGKSVVAMIRIRVS